MNTVNLALEHLYLCLQPINRALRQAAELQAERTVRLVESGRRDHCLTENHVRQLFSDIEPDISNGRFVGISTEFTDAECDRDSALHERARTEKTTLPLDEMRHALDLDSFEMQSILICAAAQMDTAYGRLFAYLHDDMNRLSPSLELLTGLGAQNTSESFQRRRSLAPHAEL